MAVAHPRAHIGRLPDELLLEIIKQPCLSPRDLICLARTSRRHHGITISAAYKAHVEDEDGIALFWAIEKNRYATLKRLIDNGVSVNMLGADWLDYPGLLPRALWEHEDKYSWAWMNVDMDGYPDVSISPLALAAYHGRYSMVKLLLDNGADREQLSAQLCECCSTLLCCPSRLPGRPMFFENPILLDDDCGYMRYALKVESWWTPLHYAICSGHILTANLLLERGASVSCERWNGVNALHVATRCNRDDMIEYLLDNNMVDINAQTDQGISALHLAYVRGRYDLVNDFLDRGADINLKYGPHRGRPGPWTIFSMACADGAFDRALQYLRRGAEPNFLINGVNHQDTWTVMRFIYRSETKEFPDQLLSGDTRVQLEREIIAGRREGATSNT